MIIKGRSSLKRLGKLSKRKALKEHLSAESHLRLECLPEH
ncbi:hypothetical protein CHCC20368_2590 [Bacillus licheniformis]|nr:hypothetical protein CHCC20368_2590 [Bacillus licheniformis]